ncbi:MAG: cytochrome c3 family protein [Pseudomonadota bacterium]|nr:cytochrome c3 family protein [Pseudomonadota bacterium]
MGAGVLISDNGNPHKMETDCSNCHLRAPRPDEAATNLFVADIETLCLRCHTGVKLAMSHPIGVKPTFKLPLDMPLDWKGELTCTTCHRMHGKDENRFFSSNKFLRRNSTGKAFCFECHQENFLSNRSLGHSVAQNTAHYTPVESFARETEATNDESSTSCLTCHDGSLASDEGSAVVQQTAGIWRHGGYSNRTSHPLGVSYGEALRKKPHAYRQMASLPSTIRLPGGNVECISCHNLYSNNERLLSVSNERSRLCLSCHRK